MELDETNIFTGIPEMDTMILHELDDKTLYNMAQVNMYVYGLLMNNNILRNRIKTYLRPPVRRQGGLRFGAMERDIFLTDPYLPRAL